MSKRAQRYEDDRALPIVIATERDLRSNIRAISRRLNDRPEIARLVFVNPILALEDVGVELSQEAKQHVIDALRFPPRLRERRARLERELPEELAALGVSGKLPLTAKRRAELLFTVLELEPAVEDARDPTRLDARRMTAYATRHPLVEKLARYEQAQRGAIVFQSRASYEAFKRGDKRHPWIRSIRFNV
jgi:hypothetical protein